uniref:Cytochrome P450 n=1 Tax=Fagus sylvatica TaxID=28930 RepID=A0A2N9FMR3_FAGSY
MFLGIRKDEVKHLLWKLSRNSCQGFAKVELKSMFSELTFNIIMRMVAGKRYYGEDLKDEEEARKFRRLVKEIATFGGVSNPAEFVPVLRWIDHGGMEKKVKGVSKRMDAFLQGLIDKQRSKDEEENTMIDHMLSLQKSQPEYYSDQIIKGFYYLPGTDTSAVTLEWAMANLLNHPDELQKARVEMDHQIGQEKLMDESRYDCTIEGYDIPRDTMLLVNAWAIHRDPKLWDDATSFKPERFENGESDAHKLMHFGLGRRACPGAGLAQRTVSLTLGSLIQCFEWERVTKEEVDMTEGIGVTMPKVVPLEAMCKARPIMHKVLSESLHDV